MLRDWYEQGVTDGVTFRRRARWALTISVGTEVILVVLILTGYTP